MRLSSVITCWRRRSKIETKKTDDGQSVEVNVVGPGTIVQFEKQGVIVFTSTLELAQELIGNWDGKTEKTLVGKRAFRRRYESMFYRTRRPRI